MRHRSAPPASSPAGDPAATRRRRKDDRPAELTAAALELFVDQGFAATRLEDVAARAGVSKGTLYLYFSSKEALFKAVIEHGMVAALVAAEERLASYQGSAVELLHELLLGWWEQIGSTSMAGVSKLIIAESRNFPELAQYYRERVIRRGRALLRSALQRGIDEGAIDKSAQKLLDTAAAINKLSEQGVAVIIGGGNSGADQINLFGALAPDSIVVAGTNFSDPKQIAEASASSSIVDATANFEYNFRLPTGTSFTIYGTSLAAPNVAGETVRMQDEGMSVKEINQLFRLRMAQQLNPQVDQIILRDVAELTPGTGKESFRELIGQYAIDPDGAAGIISAYKVADKVGGLTPEDFHQLLSAAKGSFQSPAITSGELEQLTRGFAAVPATERPAFLERMRSTRSDNAEGLLKKLGR